MALPTDNTTRYHVLPDGRTLSYGIYGQDSSEAPTIFYFHGHPGSHFEAGPLSGPAKAHGLRIIAPTRPGYSGSTHDPKRTLVSFGADVLALADHLLVHRFAILALSGGGPYALACVAATNNGNLSHYAIPSDRLVGVGIMSGLFPPTFGTAGMMLSNRILLNVVGPYLPTWFVAKLFDGALGKSARTKTVPQLEEQIVNMYKKFPESDRFAMENDEGGIRTGVINGLRGSMATPEGATGAAMDLALYACDWGFNLDDLPIGGHGDANKTPVVVWHGGQDINVPVAMVKKVAEAVPAIDWRIYEGEAHVSVVVHKADEVLTTVAGFLKA